MQASGRVVNLSAVRKIGLRVGKEQKAKILFVDDEERILNSMRALLRRQYQVTTTTDGHHALKLLEEEHFHLLVSDQRMPIMPGVELLRKAKVVSPDTVRILLTGFSDLAAIIGSVNEGEVFRFLNKPWNNQEFVATVADAVQVGLDLQADSGAATALVKKRVSQEDEKPLQNDISQSLESPEIHDEVQDTEQESLIVLNGDRELQESVRDMLPACHVLAARDYEAAIDLMMEHEVGVIISNIEGDYEGALAFFALLKREHPQVVSVILANSGDSSAIVHLINQARVYRYMFKPLRIRLMTRYLDSALKQYRNFKVKPTLLKQQKAQQQIIKPPPAPLTSLSPNNPKTTPTSGSLLVHSDSDHEIVTPVKQSSPQQVGLMDKMKKLKSFFSRLGSRVK